MKSGEPVFVVAVGLEAAEIYDDIKSVWSTRELAEAAIQLHANQDGLIPSDYVLLCFHLDTTLKIR